MEFLNRPMMSQVVLSFKHHYPTKKIIPAIKAAAQDFLNTSEGRKVWEEANHNFNYGDFDLNVSNDFCIPRGFHVIKDPKMITMNVDFNTILAQPKGEE